MTIREFYLDKYPTDDMGIELDEKATFAGLMNTLFIGADVYEYIGVGDSLIRERIFEKLSEEIGFSYKYIIDLWLNKSVIISNYLDS